MFDKHIHKLNSKHNERCNAIRNPYRRKGEYSKGQLRSDSGTELHKEVRPVRDQRKRAELVNVSIQMQELEQELAEHRATIKGKIKPLSERYGKILDELKSGGEWIKGDCYKFVDDEEKMVGIYSPEGYKLEERPVTQEERQRNVFRVVRDGNKTWEEVPATGTDN